MRGDCSRRRRFHPLRRPWYSHYRTIRLAQRILGPRGIDPLVAFKALAADASTRPNPQ